jgi:protoporphyrin/coproporphyrin ferrochelatase
VTKALLVMAYGTASGPDDIERYYTDIRGGRKPSPELVEDLRRRYEAIGNEFPLDRITREQAVGLEHELGLRAYVGYKHSPPFVAEAVRDMAADDLTEAVGIVMAPHYSRMSIGGYVERAAKAGAAHGVDVDVIESWHLHPAYLDVLTERVRDARARLPEEERDGDLVVFSAHSLPSRIEAEGDPYPRQLRETAEAVAGRLRLERFTTAWQSAGRTAEPWLGPALDEVIDKAAVEGHPAVVACPCGFTADHLEILYDVDIEAQEAARRVGLRLVRTESMNADPAFIRAVAAVIRDHTEDR